MLASCKINQKSFEIDVVSLPIADRWMELYRGVSISCVSAMDLADRDAVWSILERHRDLWPKIGLDLFCVSDPNDLMDQSCLADMHQKIVSMQRTYKKSTSVLDGKTNGDWSLLHHHLHSIEDTLLDSSWNFNGDGTARHSHDYEKMTDPYWDWETQFTPEQWSDSTTFSQHHLEIQINELGRTPWECFHMCPDKWTQEGSLVGNLMPAIRVRARQFTRSSPIEYSQWCKNNQLPIIGHTVPLADFKSNNFLSEIVKPNSIIKIELK
jgi:hypothetical protein